MDAIASPHLGWHWLRLRSYASQLPTDKPVKAVPEHVPSSGAA